MTALCSASARVCASTHRAVLNSMWGICSENEPPSSSALLHESSADSSKPAGAKRKLTKAAGASTSAAGRGSGRASGEHSITDFCRKLTVLNHIYQTLCVVAYDSRAYVKWIEGLQPLNGLLKQVIGAQCKSSRHNTLACKNLPGSQGAGWILLESQGAASCTRLMVDNGTQMQAKNCPSSSFSWPHDMKRRLVGGF